MADKLCPKVSIIIPVYNGANYIKDAIDSALAQTYNNIEIIVVNDGSNDQGETEKIVLSYGERIRYFYKQNGGVASALNKGIEEMTGEYFSWLSHDDMYTINKIKDQVDAMKLLEDKTTILYTGFELINEKGDTTYILNPLRLYHEELLNTHVFPIFKGLINGCTLLIHKTHFENIGKFDTKLRTTQDYDLWFKLFRNSKVKYIDSIGVKCREHSEQGSKIEHGYSDECNELWIKMLSSLSYQEMCEVDGSPYYFYKNLAKHLSQNPEYYKAKNIALSTANKICRKDRGKNLNRYGFKYYLFKLNQLIDNIKYIGWNKTLIKIYKKIYKNSRKEQR